jgi:twitching motility protein PilT
MDALVEMAGRDMTRFMVAWLAEPSALVRRFALSVLGRLKDPASVGALVRTATTDSDWWAREQAIEAIALVNDPRTPPYLIDLANREPDLTVACLTALHTMDAKGALPHIVGFVSSADIDVRYAALKCVEKFGEPISPDLVRPLLADASPAMRMLARELLMRWNVSAQFDGGSGVSFLDNFLVAMANAKGDDLIVSSNRKIIMKRMGEVVAVNDAPLSADQVQALLYPLLNALQIEEIERRQDVDLSYVVKSADLRFRVNVFRQHEGLGAVFRIIRSQLPELEKLGLPQAVQDFAQYPHGLVLIGGPTGSGKSTTMAALIDFMNRTMSRHIISLEDPIEVVHKRKQSLVNQREIGTHTKDFHNALRSALREDPDVLLVGEMRDLETISFAVTAAETGHLVFGTVHTVSADSSIDRIINTFPGAQQDQVRSMLADSLRAVLCQYLVKRKDAVAGRCLASEVMINNDAISNLIRKGKCFQIPSVIATSRDSGMQSMDGDLMRLFRAGVADRDDVYMKARNKRDFEELYPELKKEQAQSNAAASGVSTKSPAAPTRPLTNG